jgi:uncharacterized protein
MSIEENKEIVRKFFQGLANGDLSLMADDATFWVAGTTALSGTMSKKKLSELSAANTKGALEPFRIVASVFTAEGDRVAVEAQSSLTMADGRRYANQYHYLFIVRDGLIRGIKEYCDTAHVKELFG